MKNVNEKTQFECAQMPEVLEAVVNEETMPELEATAISNIRLSVSRIEGSSNDSGMTCIAKDDFEKIEGRIKQELGNGTFDRSSTRMTEERRAFNLAYVADRPHVAEKRLQGFFRGLNKHCDECIRKDCEDRVALSRKELAEASRIGNYTNSRRSKVGKKKLPVLSDSFAHDHV